MANHFSANHGVINVCADDKKGEPFYKLNDSVKFYNLLDTKVKTPFCVKLRSEFCKLLSKVGLWDKPLSRNIYKDNKMSERLKKIIDAEKPNVVITYLPKDLRIIKNAGFDLKKTVAMFHCPPDLETRSAEELALLQEVGYIQVLMPSFKKIMDDYGYKNVVCIGNVVKEINNLGNDQILKKKEIVCVARLDKFQKRQHLLIEAFSLIASKFPNWELLFYGGNSTPVEYKNELKKLISSYNIQNQVFLKGSVNNVINLIKESSFFVLPSSYEGLPLALGEAMSVGLPCIGFKSCPAVNELIVDGYNGYLCDENIEALAMSIENMILNEEKRIEMSKNAVISMQRYSPNNVYVEWEVLLEKLQK